MLILRIEAPHFTAGVIADALERVRITAPILNYTLGWTAKRLIAYCEQKRWKVEAMIPSTSCSR